MPLTKRVMVLFDPEQYQRLEEEAKQRRRSKGALIREAVEREISESRSASRAERIEAARRLVSMKEDILDWDELETVIARGHLNE